MKADTSNDISEYSQHYSEISFWDKLKNITGKAGKSLIKKVLVLFYSATDKDTPMWAKGVIYAALGYFILPLDGIPDIMPIFGFSDDLAAIISAMGMIHTHIKPSHKKAANEVINSWFNFIGKE